MDRAVAIKKLAKLLGKKFGYQVDPKAPKADKRAEARSLIPCARADLDTIGDRMTKRREALLAADQEYRSLKADYADRRANLDRLQSIAHHYKITVGTSSSLFFHVEAQGDTWEDVIEIVKRRKNPPAAA